MKGESSILVGERLKGGYNVGIMLKTGIILFNSSLRNREPEQVNNAHWGGGTSSIVALFLNREEAIKCLNSPDVKNCDPRWKKETLEVFEKIGNKHPVFITSIMEGPFRCYF